MARNELADVIVIGGGPAGLTAALYLARACYRVLVIEKEVFGGQITITSEVVNYPGVGKTNGKALTETMRKQAEDFGAEFMLAEVTELKLEGDIKTVVTDKGSLPCFGILIATGAHPRMVGFPGEEEFRGRGIAYCATCDGEFFSGKEVFVIGGGFAAAEESVFLTRYAKHVTILIRNDDFSCAQAVSRPAREHPKITVLPNTSIVEVKGETMLTSIRYRNTKTGEETVFAPDNDTFGVFVFAGYAPATELVKGRVELNPQGYVVTDRGQKTSLDGVYAAGDVCVKNLRQVVTAVGDGAVAATELEKYAVAMQKKTGLMPKKPNPRQTGAKMSAEPANEPDVKAQAALFSPEILQQLKTLFDKMEKPLVLALQLDEKPVSQELRQYMEELASLTDKLSVSQAKKTDESLPAVHVLREDQTDTGLSFHGVPGGHEFTSFVLGLYNAAGPGQPVNDETLAKIQGIHQPADLQIFVSLSCTKCPELVTAAQHIAALNEKVTAAVYDLNHFPELKEQYNVMSVPCMVINHEKVTFGRKNIAQIIELL